MATTTLKAIRDSIRKTIKGLDPTDPPKGRSVFKTVGPKFDWDERPKSNWDRAFSVDRIERGDWTMFGLVSEVDYIGEMTITIGHAVGHNRDTGENRRDRDILLIAKALEKKANFPAAVSNILFDRSTLRELESMWISTMVFEIHFTVAA